MSGHQLPEQVQSCSGASCRLQACVNHEPTLLVNATTVCEPSCGTPANIKNQLFRAALVHVHYY